MISNKEGDVAIENEKFLGMMSKQKIEDLYCQIVEGSYKKPLVLILPPGVDQTETLTKSELFDLGICKWDLPGKEGMRLRVIICSNADEVELLINGESYGRKVTGIKNGFLTCFEVTYLPGLIEVINYRNRMEFSREVLMSDNQMI